MKTLFKVFQTCSLVAFVLACQEKKVSQPPMPKATQGASEKEPSKEYVVPTLPPLDNGSSEQDKSNNSNQTSTQPPPLPEQTDPPPSSLLGFSYCDASWEEKPGYADYTTVNWYERSGGAELKRSFDRSLGSSLQGSSTFLKASFCERARYLSKCFVKSAEHDKNGNATKLVNWSKNAGYDYVLMRLAFAAQETGLGTIHDQCESYVCNGIGLMQIITAIAPNGEVLSNSDKRWDNVTYNILSNLSYSSRIMERKIAAISGAYDLEALARAYNGNPNSSIRYSYGAKVVSYYNQLKSCGL